jgi:hypothetical protein
LKEVLFWPLFGFAFCLHFTDLFQKRAKRAFGT